MQEGLAVAALSLYFTASMGVSLLVCFVSAYRTPSLLLYSYVSPDSEFSVTHVRHDPQLTPGETWLAFILHSLHLVNPNAMFAE